MLRIDLGILTEAEFRMEIDSLAAQCDAPELVVDLTGCEKIRSSDLNAMIALNGRLRCEGRSLALENVPQSLYEIFLLTRLDRLFRVEAERASDMAPENESVLGNMEPQQTS